MEFWGCAEQIWAVLTDCPGGRKDSGTWSWRAGPLANPRPGAGWPVVDGAHCSLPGRGSVLGAALGLRDTGRSQQLWLPLASGLLGAGAGQAS